MSATRSPNRSDGEKTRVQTIFKKAQLSEIDAYRRKRPDLPSRAEAIRQLCSLALDGKSVA